MRMGVQAPRRGAPAWTPKQMYGYFPHLKERRDTTAGKLSGGEQQMLTMCRSLLGNPRVLLIDEPTEGLAPMIVEVVIEVILDICRRGVAVVLVEQKLTIALERRRARLRDGSRPDRVRGHAGGPAQRARGATRLAGGRVGRAGRSARAGGLLQACDVKGGCPEMTVQVLRLVGVQGAPAGDVKLYAGSGQFLCCRSRRKREPRAIQAFLDPCLRRDETQSEVRGPILRTLFANRSRLSDVLVAPPLLRVVRCVPSAAGASMARPSVPGRRRTSLKGGNRGMPRCGPRGLQRYGD